MPNNCVSFSSSASIVRPGHLRQITFVTNYRELARLKIGPCHALTTVRQDITPIRGSTEPKSLTVEKCSHCIYAYARHDEPEIIVTGMCSLAEAGDNYSALECSPYLERFPGQGT